MWCVTTSLRLQCGLHTQSFDQIALVNDPAHHSLVSVWLVMNLHSVVVLKSCMDQTERWMDGWHKAAYWGDVWTWQRQHFPSSMSTILIVPLATICLPEKKGESLPCFDVSLKKDGSLFTAELWRVWPLPSIAVHTCIYIYISISPNVTCIWMCQFKLSGRLWSSYVCCLCGSMWMSMYTVCRPNACVHCTC